MRVDNQTPLVVELVRNAVDDAVDVIAFIASTVAIGEDGSLSFCRQQRPLSTKDSEMLGDLAWFKDCTAVCVEGYVQPEAPGATRGRALLSVGEQGVAIDAYGPRVWKRSATGGVVPSEPLAMTPVAMAWSEAFGGSVRQPTRLVEMKGVQTLLPGHQRPYSDNPHGRGLYASAQEAIDQPLPALDDPEAPLRSPDDRPEPRCFAPYPASGGLRRHFLGRPIDAEQEHAPLLELPRLLKEMPKVEELPYSPEDFPRLMSRAAPQTTFDRLAPGTTVTVSGMTPGGGLLTLQLPEAPAALMLRGGERVSEVPLMLDSVDIDTEARNARLVYRGRFRVPLVRYERRKLDIGGTPVLDGWVKRAGSEAGS